MIDIYSLKWYKLITVFKENLSGVLNFSTLQAIVKGSYYDAFPENESLNGIPVFFHVKNRKYSAKLKKDQEFIVEIIIARHSYEDVKRFIDFMTKRMQNPENSRRYKLVSVSEPVSRNLRILEKDFNYDLIENNELTINFLTPYSMIPSKDYPEGWIDTEKFFFKFKARLNSFFRLNIEFNELDRINREVTAIPYWNYVRHFTHKAKSQKNTTQYIHGFVGKFYFKGNISLILPLIILGEELHTGSRVSNSQGYYRIIKNIPHFDTYFPNEIQILTVLQDTIEHYDTQEKEIKNKKDFLDDLSGFANKIKNDILNPDYKFSPTESFKIMKKDKTFRVVERYNFEEVVINNYLLKLMYNNLNRFISLNSIGYRKGISREKAIFFIKENLKDGYNVILESDIEAFFSSINLKKLEGLINLYLPSKDVNFKRILLSSIYASYKKGNKVYERKIGLSQGSSISPLLANLYLNYFDDKIKKENVRFIRYADDFIIMTKSFDKAIDMLKKISDILGELNLKIKQTKTKIRSISDGFKFLGYEFKGYNNDAEIATFSNLLKKPLYIIEPYIKIAVKHDSLDLLKEEKVFASIPLRRISEIIIMNKALISSALAQKCREFKIPVSFTFGKGYDITTLRPDSKSWYTISSKHYNKYSGLSEKEILEFAKLIVFKKFDTMLSLFKKRDRFLYDKYLKKITVLKEKIQMSNNLNSLRGYEGIAAREAFGNYNYFIIDPEFHITKRERFSKEKINSLLNFGYYILFIRINTTLRAMGLNPYLGFLHSGNNRYESLVADIQEFFRADIDNFIIKTVNMKIIQKKDFLNDSKGVMLSYEGRRHFINAIEGEFNRRDKYGETLSGRIYIKILNIKNWVLDKENLFF